MSDRSITVSKKGVTVTINFTHGGNTKRTMKIATGFVSKLLEQFVSKLTFLEGGYWLESAAPKKTELTKILEEPSDL